MRTFRRGDSGEDVRDVQHRLVALGASIDPSELGGTFGFSTEAAVRAFQQRRGLLVDGVVGSETWDELVEAGFVVGDRTLYLRHPYFRGDDVRALQRRLNALGFDAGREDGIFGPRSDRAVREFQRNTGRDPDGTAHGFSDPTTHIAKNCEPPPYACPSARRAPSTWWSPAIPRTCNAYWCRARPAYYVLHLFVNKSFFLSFPSFCSLVMHAVGGFLSKRLYRTGQK